MPRFQDLESALAERRIGRDPALAEEIERLSDDLPIRPIEGRTRKDRHRDWLAREAGKDPRELPALLATLAAGTQAEVRERLERLAGRPEDLRIATALVALVEVPPLESGSGPIWTRIFDLLVGMRDGRAVRRLEAVRTEPAAFGKAALRARWAGGSRTPSNACAGRLPGPSRNRSCSAGSARSPATRRCGSSWATCSSSEAILAASSSRSSGGCARHPAT